MLSLVFIRIRPLLTSAARFLEEACNLFLDFVSSGPRREKSMVDKVPSPSFTLLDAASSVARARALARAPAPLPQCYCYMRRGCAWLAG